MTLSQTKIDMQAMGQRAKDAAFALAKLSTEQKNACLLTIADLLDAQRDTIFDANAQGPRACPRKRYRPYLDS
jgi:gamma-glutamyl phosphate reductase